MSLAGVITYYETAFAVIDGTAPYTSAVRLVCTRSINPLKEPAANFPLLAITPAGGGHAVHSRALDMVTEVVEVEGWVVGEPGASHVAALLALWEDAKRVIRLDLKCGGAAIGAHLPESGHEFLWTEESAGFLQKIVVQYAEARTP